MHFLLLVRPPLVEGTAKVARLQKEARGKEASRAKLRSGRKIGHCFSLAAGAAEGGGVEKLTETLMLLIATSSTLITGESQTHREYANKTAERISSPISEQQRKEEGKE
jgi:hypothetical protein